MTIDSEELRRICLGLGVDHAQALNAVKGANGRDFTPADPIELAKRFERYLGGTALERSDHA